MLDFSTATLDKFASTWVGNKGRYEGLKIPKTSLLNLSEVSEELVILANLAPFKKSSEFFYLFDEKGPHKNKVYNSVKAIFADPANLGTETATLANLLYECTVYPKVQGGEFFVSLFKDILLDGEVTEAVVLWKVEDKTSFIHTENSAESLLVSPSMGIQTTPKVAAIIFNLDENEGYRLCLVDKITKKDERSFWKDDFLRVREVEDNYFQTKHTMACIAEFITSKARFKFGLDEVKTMALLDKAVNYFKDFDEWTMEDFCEKVFDNEDMADALNLFYSEYKVAYALPLDDFFELSSVAVKKFSSLFVNRLKLDKNFKIQVISRPDLIEGGYDEEKGKKFYKIYFETQE